jgi:ABC-2 type transport system ATP-binding protein
MESFDTALATGREYPSKSAVANTDIPVICLEHVSKQYRGGGGVYDVDLEVFRGEVFGFLGPNGAGKTTTIRLILDLIRPDKGSISIFGLELPRKSVETHRRIGYLPGELALYDRLTARELLTHFAYLRSGPSDKAIEEIASQFMLELDRPMRDLSKGNRQKVGLVQAFMGDPDLLILDEPTSGLDPIVQRQVHQSLRRAANVGRTVFLSSHVMSEVAEIADRVALIRDGSIVSIERVEEMLGRSKHRVDVELAEAAPRIDFHQIPGVTDLVVNGNHVQFKIAGDLNLLVRELARCELVDVSIREPTLEELFLSFYEQSDA